MRQNTRNSYNRPLYPQNAPVVQGKPTCTLQNTCNPHMLKYSTGIDHVNSVNNTVFTKYNPKVCQNYGKCY